jgi:hypothetical protein
MSSWQWGMDVWWDPSKAFRLRQVADVLFSPLIIQRFGILELWSLSRSFLLAERDLLQ